VSAVCICQLEPDDDSNEKKDLVLLPLLLLPQSGTKTPWVNFLNSLHAAHSSVSRDHGYKLARDNTFFLLLLLLNFNCQALKLLAF
jgi:hypothetical protein